MPANLFGREAKLVVGDYDVGELDFGFNVTKHLRKEPNTAKITVYGLSEQRRQALEDRKDKVPVELSAGYQGASFLIFLGLLDSATSHQEGPEWVTTVHMDDGKKGRKKRGAISFKAGGSWKKAAQDLVKNMDVSAGNLVEKLGAKLSLEQLGSVFSSGFAAKGNSQDTLERILNGAGLTHSIQNGELEVREIGEPLFPANNATILKPDTGLIGTPSVDRLGRIEARALIVPGLNPGHAVKIESSTANGIWVVDSVEYSGSTHGSDWYAEIEGAPIK